MRDCFIGKTTNRAHFVYILRLHSARTMVMLCSRDRQRGRVPYLLSTIERSVTQSLYVSTLMWHRGLVVVRAHASKEYGSLPDFLRIRKPSLTHERENSILRVVPEVMTGVNHARQEARLT